MQLGKKSDKSLDLLRVSDEYFQKILHPYLVEHFPQIMDHTTIIVSSSVAYGLADGLSDLDLFVLLSQNDYDTYRYALEGELAAVEKAMPDELKKVCDRGARSQIVTFEMCGVDQFKRGGPRDWTHVDETLCSGQSMRMCCMTLQISWRSINLRTFIFPKIFR
jgi:hypothetical protein